MSSEQHSSGILVDSTPATQRFEPLARGRPCRNAYGCGADQRGWCTAAPFAIFATFWLKDQRMRRMTEPVLPLAPSPRSRSSRKLPYHRVAGVDFAVWRRWCAVDGLWCAGRRFAFPRSGSDHSAVFGRSHGNLRRLSRRSVSHVNRMRPATSGALFLPGYRSDSRVPCVRQTIHQFASSRAPASYLPGARWWASVLREPQQPPAGSRHDP